MLDKKWCLEKLSGKIYTGDSLFTKLQGYTGFHKKKKEKKTLPCTVSNPLRLHNNTTVVIVTTQQQPQTFYLGATKKFRRISSSQQSDMNDSVWVLTPFRSSLGTAIKQYLYFAPPPHVPSQRTF